MARIELSQNEFFERLVGTDHIDSNDVQFWYQLLSCSFNFMRVHDPKLVDKSLEPYIVRLALNNSQSFNIGSLVRVFLDRASRVKSASGQSANPYYVYQSFNALYLIRTVCKSYIETSSEEQMIKAFKAKIDAIQTSQAPPLPPVPPVAMQSSASQSQEPSDGVGASSSRDRQVPEQTSFSQQTPPGVDMASQNVEQTNQVVQDTKKVDFTTGSIMMEQFISALISFIVDIPLTDTTYLLQVEAINALLVLLSVQMYSSVPANKSAIYRCIMQKKCSIHALVLTKTLLNNFMKQDPMPQETGSIIIGLASGLWRVLTLGYGGQIEEDVEEMPLLARQSLLLLNILTNHFTTERNIYREAIVSCQDSAYNLAGPQMALDNVSNDVLATATTSKEALISNSIKINFRQLYDTMCKHLHNDQVALLLYLLLHSNKIYRPYILTSIPLELDKLLLPLLRILYSSIEKGSHHVYMVLIIFIILSEETSFNEVIHKITIRGIPWYKDRLISEISLGSLTALIIVRSIQYNTLRIRDMFLHTNLFATLANLSNHFHLLHPYVCQRLVDLLERLSKRYSLVTKSTKSISQTSDLLNSNNPLAKALATDTLKQELNDASSLELDSTTPATATAQGNGSSNQNQNGTGAMAINMANLPDQQQQQQQRQQPQQQLTQLGSQSESNVILPPLDVQAHEYPLSPQAPQSSSGSCSSTTNEQVNISMDEGSQDVALIEEVIRMILEVINNSLATQLESNPDLIYTLLYKRNVFSTLLSSHQSFYNMVINIERVLTFFYNKIEAYERPMSVEEIKALIRSSSTEWHYDRDPNARLLFHYVEDEQPEEFFIPYIWTRIYYSSGIVWNSKRIILFNPDDL